MRVSSDGARRALHPMQVRSVTGLVLADLAIGGLSYLGAIDNWSGGFSDLGFCL